MAKEENKTQEPSILDVKDSKDKEPTLMVPLGKGFKVRIPRLVLA